MAKKNYSKMYPKDTEAISEKPKVVEEPAIVNTVTDNPLIVDDIVETDTPEVIPTFGIVSGCTKLNVRTKPDSDAEVAYVVSADTELNIDFDKSTNDWYHVSNAAGIEGFCMKNYIFIKE